MPMPQLFRRSSSSVKQAEEDRKVLRPSTPIGPNALSLKFSSTIWEPFVSSPWVSLTCWKEMRTASIMREWNVLGRVELQFSVEWWINHSKSNASKGRKQQIERRSWECSDLTSISGCFSKVFPIAVAAASLIVLPSSRKATNCWHCSISSHSSFTRKDIDDYASFSNHQDYHHPRYFPSLHGQPKKVRVRSTSSFSKEYLSYSIFRGALGCLAECVRNICEWK